MKTKKPWLQRLRAEPERAVDIDALFASDSFQTALTDLSRQLSLAPDKVRADGRQCLHELQASIHPMVMGAWLDIGRRLLGAYDLVADESALARLRDLDRRHSLIWLPSHRSYLDTWVLPTALTSRGLSSSYFFGGANLDFFPFGPLARRTGMIFVRRKADDPVYRLALRSYVGELVRNRANLGWSIEGGRTRTGKLRPPRYGLLRYLVDATQETTGPEIFLVPMSIVYDQLHEVASMAGEALGQAKRPEDIGWLLRFVRQQRKRLGHLYLDIGEPVPLRERLAAYAAQPGAATHVTERVALEVCHRINRATPVTLTAVVTLALLAADRALNLDEAMSTIEPIARYIAQRQWPVAGGESLSSLNAVRRTLRELVQSGVLEMHEDGREAIWAIVPGQHLVAAFYRNTAIHLLVNRAIAEMALLAAAEAGESETQAAGFEAALSLRELLKFEFFFPSRAEFGAEMRAEMALIDRDWETRSQSQAERLLEQARPHVAHLVLRPFLDAYRVVAERLAAMSADEAIDEKAFLDGCLRTARLWLLQRRLASAESVSLELFQTALRLARQRGLLAETGGEDLAARRRALADEIGEATRRLARIAAMARHDAQTARP